MKTQKTQSNNESASSSEATSTRKPPVRNPLELLAGAIRKDRAQPSGDDDGAEVPDGDGDADGEQPNAKPKPKKSKAPKSLEAVAEVLGIEAEELYKIEVPAKAKGAKPLTLGALKDLAAADGDFQVRTLRLDQDRRTLESERVEAEAELQAVLQALPADAMKSEAMQKLRNTLAAKHAKERARTLDVIPEWQDEAVRTADLKGMVDFARTEYGLPETYLLTHMDHRLVRLMRDAWRNAVTIKKALEEVEETRTTTPPKGNAPKPTQKRQSTPAGRTSSQVGRFVETIVQAAQRRQ